jgi:hypothetical protein
MQSYSRKIKNTFSPSFPTVIAMEFPSFLSEQERDWKVESMPFKEESL